ncbi:MAG: ABC transporter ATP-binding protein [Proteobacteria bacterium]|nr:ABC transporter ATP-binding protein [Pseudomonadota bacterium]
MTLAIRSSNLVKTYRAKPPVEAVRGIDLEVEEGECFGVLGPNGAGKTTTIEILEGLLPATSGDVEILGLRWNRDAMAIREQIGISLQETRLADKVSVLETLTLFRSFYRDGIDPEAVMRSVSLEEKSRAWVKKLSGGQKQRLAVATALVGDPKLLFLDEPTTGLDPSSRRQLWDIIAGFREQGRTVLLTTHYMEEAERLCDRVAILDGGKVIALGTPPQLIAGLGAEHIVEFAIDSGVSDPPLAEHWNDLPAVTGSTYEDGSYRLSVSHPHLVIPALIDRLEGSGLRMASLTTRHASLDDVFVSLTGRQLEEPEGDHE